MARPEEPLTAGTGTEAVVASRVQRLGAFLADGFVMGALLRGLVALGVDLTGLGSALLITAYTIAGTAVWGQTAGKAFVGIRVVRPGTDGAPGWWWSTVRWAVPSAAWFIPGAPSIVRNLAELLLLVVYAPILWDPLRRGLHDRAAGTLVVQAR